MNEKTIFIILLVVTVILVSVAGVLAWHTMQPNDVAVHEVDLSNVSANNETASDTNIETGYKEDKSTDTSDHPDDCYDCYYEYYDDDPDYDYDYDYDYE